MASEALLDRLFLEKLERLTIHWEKSFSGLVGGHNSSRFAGGGQEFLDHRHFHHGDDLRAVNWRAYMRLEKMFLKMFQIEPRVPVRLLLDTSAIIDGRVADLIEANFIEGIIVVPRFVLKELQQVADSNDAIKRARGRRGLQRNPRQEVKIHDGDFPDEKEVDSKLIRLARNLGAKLFTNDYNLCKLAELQSINFVNMHELAKSLKSTLLPGEILTLRVVREGKDKGQGIGYLPDGTMVVINNAQSQVGQQVQAQVQNSLQTGAGIIIFADLHQTVTA